MPARPSDIDAFQRVLELVIERLGCEPNANSLARALGDHPGVDSIAAGAAARKWFAGSSVPGFDYTMTLLSAAGLLAREADSAWRGLVAQPEPLSRNGDWGEEEVRRETGG